MCGKLSMHPPLSSSLWTAELIDDPDPDGLTALMVACGAGHEEVARLLLQRGAETEPCQEGCRSPLRLLGDAASRA